MSIIRCKTCEASVDTDFNAEHEEECKAENRRFRLKSKLLQFGISFEFARGSKETKEAHEEVERLAEDLLDEIEKAYE